MPCGAGRATPCAGAAAPREALLDLHRAEDLPGRARTIERYWEEGVLVRTTGDIVALSPPLIVERPQVDRILGTLPDAIRAEAA